MSIATAITAGAVTALAGGALLLVPLFRLRRVRTEIEIIDKRHGVGKSLVLQGETGEAAIQKILNDLTEGNGDEPTPTL